MDESAKPASLDDQVQKASKALGETNLETRMAQEKRIEMKYRLNDLLEKQKRIESSIRIEIQSALDPKTNKPLYSNEKTRDAAFLEAADQNPEFCVISKEISSLMKNLDLLDAELDMLRHGRRHLDLDYQYLIAATCVNGLNSEISVV
ncbi:MAG: hypothetical protein ACP5I1_16250 [Candidatus Hinthialibacter sp.]